MNDFENFTTDSGVPYYVKKNSMFVGVKNVHSKLF